MHPKFLFRSTCFCFVFNVLLLYFCYLSKSYHTSKPNFSWVDILECNSKTKFESSNTLEMNKIFQSINFHELKLTLSELSMCALTHKSLYAGKFCWSLRCFWNPGSFFGTQDIEGYNSA